MSGPRVRLAATAVRGEPSAEEIGRIEALGRPMAEVLVSLDPQERFNLMGSLLCTYALLFDQPRAAVVQLASSVCRELPGIEASVRQSDRPS